MELIVRQFLPDFESPVIQTLGTGLIHQTFKVHSASSPGQFYVLQAINQGVFREPEKVMHNILLVQKHLQEKSYSLAIPKYLQTKEGAYLFFEDSGVAWRMSEFVPQTTTFDQSTSPEISYLTGKGFGEFLTALQDLDPRQLENTLPDFHNLNFRYQQFQEALRSPSGQRTSKALIEIEKTQVYYKRFRDIDFSGIPMRVVHNDCKLSNLLFDEKTLRPRAVIDLDTLMPGYLATDFGDMVRGICNTASEEEADIDKIEFDQVAYKRLLEGFLSKTENWMTGEEKGSLQNGVIYIVLEQIIRFLTDYLNGDTYYATSHADQNLHRTQNQLKLLESFLLALKNESIGNGSIL